MRSSLHQAPPVLASPPPEPATDRVWLLSMSPSDDHSLHDSEAHPAQVEDNLYRSGHPTELNFPFLERLHLKKILYLSPESPPQAFKTFVDDQVGLRAVDCVRRISVLSAHAMRHSPSRSNQGIDLQLLGLGEEQRQTASWSPIAEEHGVQNCSLAWIVCECMKVCTQ